jgi:hypothetical protein
MEDEAEVPEEMIRHALRHAVSAYIAQRRERVPSFIRNHFSLRGALRLHRKGIGADLYKAPLNLFWAWPRLLSRLLSSVARARGLDRLASWLNQLTVGVETDVQRELTWLLYTDLLEIPCQDGKRESLKDALLEELLYQPEITALYRPYVQHIRERENHAEFKTSLEHTIREFCLTREAASDMATNTMTLVAGGLVFNQMTPGALAISGALSQAIAYHLAVSGCFLGPTLGALYYHYFPPTPSLGLLIATILSTLAALALVSSFSGIIVDPLLALLGVHERRLHHFITHLERLLLGYPDHPYRLYDHYYARVFDFVDYLSTIASKLKF